MKVTLSEEAKRQILFEACVNAKNKFCPNAIVSWEDEKYKVLVHYYSQIPTTRRGLFRKKTQNSSVNLNCASVKIFRMEFSDFNWGEVVVTSFHRDFDKLAEEIAHNIEKYTPVDLVINDPAMVSASENPSRRMK
jgi:hypothetical protein